ncbi:MAG: hypothetical protein COB51_03990 [Moraxellaceae bacterium]|nr:MAG: hypothetical protein COB51_03990 [Moraxellaceae bacterium]
MAPHRFPVRYDAAVRNFSLLGKESVEHVFKVTPQILNPGGIFIVQTLHPEENTRDGNADQWREGTWDGFTIIDTLEPVNPRTQKAASMMLIGQTS